MYVRFFNRMHLVPERQSAGNNEANEDTDQEEPAIRGKGDQENRYYGNGDDECRRSSEAESRAATRVRFHDIIVAPL